MAALIFAQFKLPVIKTYVSIKYSTRRIFQSLDVPRLPFLYKSFHNNILTFLLTLDSSLQFPFIKNLFYDDDDKNGERIAPLLTWYPVSKASNGLLLTLTRQSHKVTSSEPAGRKSNRWPFASV